jgi:pectate lyase
MLRNARASTVRRWSLPAAAAAVLTAAAIAFALPAQAATLFGDDFEDGNSSGWTTSGGSWTVVTDGSRVLRQSSTGADASGRAGSTSWTNYTVSARIKPLAFGAANRQVALLGRVRSSTSYYYLALTASNTLVLGRRSSGTLTPLASTAFTVATGTWYTLTLRLSGSTLSGSVAGGPTVSATDTAYGSGQTGIATSFASAEADDVLAVDTAGPGPSGSTSSGPSTPPPSTPPPTTPPPTTPPPTTPPPGCASVPAGQEGWAAVNGATTGGCGGAVVTVTTLAQLQAEANKRDTPEVIMVSGMINGPGEVVVRNNKSIVGVGPSSGLVGIELSIEHMHPANVIVRNLTITKVTSSTADGDAIHIQDADHVWVDHNTLSSDLTHGVDFYDGLLDVTHAGDYITVSWNHFATHIKTSLVGHDDDNASEDTGHLRISYHHNWFDQTMERGPRLRFGDPVHIYDNYYSNISGDTAYYAIASTMNAGALVENNVFENVIQACWSASGYADSGPGRLVARNNQLINSGPCETNGTVAPIPYAYHLDDVGAVKALVTAGSGAGHS